MIRYELQCDRGHGFDGWFRDSASYERQAEASLLSCPQCGSVKVGKAVMAPHIAKSRPQPPEAARPPPKPDPRAEALPALFRRIREKVAAHAEYVGERFPEEARRIHYEETEPRGIYGEASLEEAKSLHEEGIEVFPLPPLPEERN